MKKNTPCGRLIYAAPELCADLLYAGGFNAPDPIVWFEIKDLRAIVVSILDDEEVEIAQWTFNTPEEGGNAQ
jgi:hypothetical protein